MLCSRSTAIKISECYVTNISLFGFGVSFVLGGFFVCFFLFGPRQIQSLSSVSSVENDLVILEIYGPQNSFEVCSCFFLHSTFSFKEIPCCLDILVRVRNKLSSLRLSVRILPVPCSCTRVSSAGPA